MREETEEKFLDWINDEDAIFAEAVINARDAFFKTFDENGIDSIYYAVKVIGYELNTDDTRTTLSKFIIDTREERVKLKEMIK